MKRYSLRHKDRKENLLFLGLILDKLTMLRFV